MAYGLKACSCHPLRIESQNFIGQDKELYSDIIYSLFLEYFECVFILSNFLLIQ